MKVNETIFRMGKPEWKFCNTYDEWHLMWRAKTLCVAKKNPSEIDIKLIVKTQTGCNLPKKKKLFSKE